MCFQKRAWSKWPLGLVQTVRSCQVRIVLVEWQEQGQEAWLMTLVEKWTQQPGALSKGVSYASQRINETHLSRHCLEALAFGAGIFLHNFAWGLRLLFKHLSWIGWQLFEYTTAASTFIILLEGLSAILSLPSPGYSPPPPTLHIQVSQSYQHISCKSFLYSGDSMHMRND